MTRTDEGYVKNSIKSRDYFLTNITLLDYYERKLSLIIKMD